MLRNAFLFLLLAGSSFAWWDASFTYRTPVNISNAGTTLTDYQANIPLNTQALVSAGKMRSDCGDLRIVASNDSAQLPFWIESGCNTNATKIWVKAPSIPAGTSTIYAYYGKPTATNASNGTNTFMFFDDISGVYSWDSPWVDYTSDYASPPKSKFGYTTNLDGIYPTTTGVNLSEKANMPTSGVIEMNLKDLGGTTQEWLQLKSSTSTDSTTKMIFSMNIYTGRGFYRGDFATWSDLTVANTLFNGSWNKLKVTYNSTSTKIKVNNDPEVSLGTTTSVGYPTKLGLYDSGSVVENNYLLDNIFVRQYASPEPAATTLAEQEALQFAYRMPITINNTGSSLIDYQVNLTINTSALVAAGKMRSDCGDIRFTNSTAYSTQNWTASYPYWIESGCNTSATKIWVNVPSIPTGTNTIYTYYGNVSAASASSGANTFDFFDDFSGDLSKWTASSGTWAIDLPNILKSTATVTGAPLIYHPFATYNNIVVFGKVKVTDVVNSLYYPLVKAATSGTDAINSFGIRFGRSKVEVIDNNIIKATTAFAYTGNSWYNYEYSVGPDNSIIARVWKEGDQKPASATLTYGAFTPQANGVNIRYNGNTPSYSVDYWSNFIIRKYASPEPTATEQQPDTTAPSVQIQSPTGQAYVTATVPVNFTVTDNAAVSCTVRLNGTVNSSTCDNYTLTLANGAYALNVSANDTAGNTNSSQVSFTVAVPSGQQTNTTQASTDSGGVALGTIGFTFTPSSLTIQAGGQTVSKAMAISSGVNMVQIKAKVTLKGQPVQGKQVTYTLFGQG